MPFETFFRWVKGHGQEGQMIKWSKIELVQAITSTFMHGFQNNNLAQWFSLRSRGAI